MTGPIIVTVVIPPTPLPFVVNPPTVNQISGPGGDHFGPGDERRRAVHRLRPRRFDLPLRPSNPHHDHDRRGGQRLHLWRPDHQRRRPLRRVPGHRRHPVLRLHLQQRSVRRCALSANRPARRRRRAGGVRRRQQDRRRARRQQHRNLRSARPCDRHRHGGRDRRDRRGVAAGGQRRRPSDRVLADRCVDAGRLGPAVRL